MAGFEDNLDSGFALLGLVPSQPAVPPQPVQYPVPPSGAPLTRREARELQGAPQSAEPLTYVASPFDAVPTTQHEFRLSPTDFPRRSASAPVTARGQRGATRRRKAIRRLAGSTPRRPHSSTPSKLFSLGALVFAGALFVGTSVPANAFITDSTALAATTTGAAPAADVPMQSLEVSPDAIEAAPARDTFQVISYAEVLALKYGNRLTATYTVTTGAVRWPFPYYVPITDGFGPRYLCDTCSNFHKGVDFVPGEGTPIYAIADGVVIEAQEDTWDYGNHVLIQHNINGQNVESLYGHMLTGTRAVNVGDVVKVGDFLGLVGDTGTSYGAHLHLEIHLDKVAVDPFAWLQANAVN